MYMVISHIFTVYQCYISYWLLLDISKWIVEIKYYILHAHFPIFLLCLNLILKNTNDLMLIVIFSKSENKYQICTVQL